MKFIGNNSEFNNNLRPLLTLDDSFTVISYVDDITIEDITDSKVILLLPIDKEIDYFKYTGLAYDRMITSAFASLNVYTSIFLFMHEYIDINLIAETVNNFDKVNLVDNIWIYPKLENYKIRDNNVENLLWQKSIKNMSD